MTLVFIAVIIVLVLLSVITRSYWGLAKLGATPAWLFLCSAFTLGAFIIIYWVADVKGKSNWFKLIRPAGTDTLLTYLMPYIAGFVLMRVLHVRYPDWMLTGGVGLVKCILFVLLCVWLTRILNKLGVRLKL